MKVCRLLPGLGFCTLPRWTPHGELTLAWAAFTEEEAAKAYEEFVEAFGGEEEGGPGSAGGAAGERGKQRSAAKGFVRAGGGGYNPLKDKELAAPVATPPTGPSGARGNRPSAMSLLDDDEASLLSLGTFELGVTNSDCTAQPDVVVPKLPPGKKPRDMDKFLEELKRSFQLPPPRVSSPSVLTT